MISPSFTIALIEDTQARFASGDDPPREIMVRRLDLIANGVRAMAFGLHLGNVIVHKEHPGKIWKVKNVEFDAVRKIFYVCASHRKLDGAWAKTHRVFEIDPRDSKVAVVLTNE